MTEKVGKIEFVIKGGKPWGFTLQGGSENRSAVIVNEIEPGGKAERQGSLKVGDHVIKINDVHCLSLSDALQLIDSAFRTLTILVWRPSQCFQEILCQESSLTDQEFYAEHSIASSNASLNSVPILSVCSNIPDSENGRAFVDLNGRMAFSSSINKVNSSQLSVYSNQLYCDSFMTPSVDAMKFEKKFSFSDEPRNLNISSNKFNYSSHHRYSSTKKDLPLFPFKTQGTYNFQRNHADNHVMDSYKMPKSILKKDAPMLHNEFKAPLQVQGKKYDASKNSRNGEMKCSLAKQMTTSRLTECVCCMYPKCHSKYLDCKVHSPPERDIVLPQDGIDQNPSDSHHSYSNICYDNQIYDNVAVLNMLPKNIYSENFNTTLCEENDINNDCGVKHSKFNVNNPCNVSFVSDSHTEGIYGKILKKTGDLSYNKTSRNSLDCHKRDNMSQLKELSNSNEENNNSKETLCFIQNFEEIIPDKFSQQNLNKFGLNEIHKFDNRKLKEPIHLASNDSSYDNFATIKNSTGRYHQDFHQHILDEELCFIEKNAHKHSEVLLSASLSPVVPLPSPPVNILNEIIPTDESLPSPPASPVTITTNKLTKREEKPEVIYENLEMLNIKCSVVNSSTQTSEPDTSADKPSVQPDKLNDSAFPNKLKNSCMEKTKVQNLCSVASASTKSPIDKFANDRRILSLPLTSAYFTTSEPKAKLLTRYISNLHQDNIPVGRELGSKKEELMASITKKLDILRLEQVALKEEMKQNDELGNTLATKVELSAKPNETEKFRLHVEELEKITNLMLSLSGRLARAENALLILPADITSAEKNVLEMKYSTLKEQYEEAKYLKKNIDRRNCQISLFLRKYFTEDEFADYDHFIKMKAKLLMDDRELDEKIKLGEEQLTALKNSLNTQALRQLKNSSSNLQ